MRRAHLRALIASPAAVAAGAAPSPAAAFSIGGRSLDNPYTVFVVSALIVAGWLVVFLLLAAGRGDR